MPLFTFINDVNANNSNQAIEELNMHKINNKFKDTIKHITVTFTKPLDFAFKE